MYEASRRSPLCSVNFVTAHDGFTLADLTAYARKHNAANGEDNKDGESDNRSTNSGAEGPTDDEAVNARRDRMRRNFLATLLLSAGVPMILGGDEIARTQGGNNNAYCQDNEISWYDWSSADDELRQFTADLVALRTAEPALRPDWYRAAPAEPRARRRARTRRSGCCAPTARPSPTPTGTTRAPARIMFVFAHRDGDTFALLLNAAENGVEFTVAPPLHAEWELVVSSDPEQTVPAPVSTLIVRDCSFTLLRSQRG